MNSYAISTIKLQCCNLFKSVGFLNNWRALRAEKCNVERFIFKNAIISFNAVRKGNTVISNLVTKIKIIFH